MIIQCITLTNFLCYYGTDNKFEFTDGLNLILGPNGYGKSKLYNAFQWVFKDGITDEFNPGVIKYTNNLKKSIISDKALAETQIGEKVKCEVVIDVKNTAGSIYRLKRVYRVERKSSDEWLEQPQSKLEVYKKDSINFRPLREDYANEILESIIPAEIMPYVWFQGEHGVNNTIDISSATSLRNVIEKFSDIATWEKYIEIAEKVAFAVKKEYDAIIKKSQKNKKEKDEFINDQEDCQNELERIKQELREAKNNVEEAKIKANSVIGKFDSSKKIDKMNKELDEIKKELEEAISLYNSSYMDFTKNLYKKNWLLMGTEKFVDLFEEKYNKYIDYINDKKAAISIYKPTRLPKGVPERMHVQKMLDQEVCLICNRPAPKGSKEYEAIKELLPQSAELKINFNDIDLDLRRLYNHGFRLTEKFENADQEIIDLLKKREELDEQIKDLEVRRDQLIVRIDNEIINSGVDQAIDIISTYTSAIDDIENYNLKIGKLEESNNRITARLQGITLKLHKLTEGEISPVLEKKLELTEDLKNLTIRIKDTQYNELIELLERTANEHYEKMNKPTGAFYGKIKFIETSVGGYKPIILDENDNKVINLNTSQTTSLKLAIIMAIVTTNKNRGYADKYPLISDAPISDFDAVKSKLFLVEVSNTYNQSIVIVKDYLKEDPSRNKRYILDFERLQELQEHIRKNGSNLNIIQLDIPDETSIVNREKLQINIKPVGDLWIN